MITGLFLLFSSFSQATIATPPVLHPELVQPVKNNNTSRPIVHTEDELSQYELSAAFRYDQTSFKQSGRGQQYDTEPATGTSVVIHGVKKISKDFIRTHLQISKATFKEPNDIGGKDVRVSRQQLSLSYGRNFHALSFGVGLGFTHQSTGSFSTNTNLIPEYNQVGPQFSLHYKKSLLKNFIFEPFLSALIPLYFEESGENTGSHKWGIQSLLGFNLKVRLNRYLHFILGVNAEFERHEFRGEGDRGVEDAIVDYKALTFPVGISYVF